MRIDFHTHSFPDHMASRVVERLSHLSHSRYYLCPTIQNLSDSMKTAGIDYSVNLPVVTRADQTVSVNDRMISSLETDLSAGIIHFGGMHPDFSSYGREIKRLSRQGIRGIKLHPPYQGAALNDIRYKRIIEAANEEDMAVIVHAGLDIGLPDKNYASPEMILDLLKDVRPSRLILAHFGGWQGWELFEKHLAGAPVYIDTAFSLGTILPAESEEDLLIADQNLSADEFVRLSRKHGTNKVLFATDSPWADQKEYVTIIENSSLNEEEKQNIFCLNAMPLLGLNRS